MRCGVRQGQDDLQKLDDGPGPAMSKYDRQSVRMLRPGMDEMDSETVNFRAELWQRIEFTLKPAPIVMGAPVFGERLCFGQRYTFGPVAHRLLVRPTCIGK